MTDVITLLITGIFIIILINIYYLFSRIVNQTKKARNSFEEFLQRKIEIFFEIVKEVKKYASFGRDVEKEIKKTIQKVEQAETLEQKKSLNKILSSIINSIFKVSDDYSDLRISKKIRELKKEFKEIEEGMDAFKDLWFMVIKFFKKFKRTKRDEFFEEKRVKVKIKKK